MTIGLKRNEEQEKTLIGPGSYSPEKADSITMQKTQVANFT
jgi:hypothetical protein